MITNRSKPGGDIVPSLIYDDVDQAVAWLCDVFGFTERLRAAGPDGKSGHAQLAIGMGGVLLGVTREGARPPSKSIMINVADVEEHYERARQRGARIVQPPTTYPFGERQYTAEDPAGHRWTFSQSVADAKPEEWGATIAHIESPLALLPRPRVCYLEIPAIDVHQSAAFYEKVFGWNIRNRDTNRPSFDDATGYVSGAWVIGRTISREAGLLPYIWVDGMNNVLERVTANGGEVVEAPHMDSPDGGAWIATVRDPAGNLVGLYQEAPL